MSDTAVVPARTRAAIVKLAAVAVAITAVVVIAGLVTTHTAAAGVGDHDLGISKWFVRHRGDDWNTATLIGSNLARTETVVLIAVVVGCILRVWLGRWYEAGVLIVALGGELAIFLTATAIVHRSRPPVPRLDAAPPTSSFPSGHTAAAVTVYGFLAVMVWRHVHRRWLAVTGAALLVTVPVLVALSRLYRGAHYPSDVIASAIFASVWLATVVTTLLPRSEEQPT